MLYYIPTTHLFRDHSFKQKTELAALDAAVCGTHTGNDEGTLLQSFVPDGQTVAVPIEQFDHVPSTVAKYKQGTRKGILIELCADQSAQPIEGLSHVTRSPVQIGGCPITYTYSKKEIIDLLKEFKVVDISADHIFPYKISDYIKYQYNKVWYFRYLPKPIFRWFERKFGWHLLITVITP